MGKENNCDLNYLLSTLHQSVYIYKSRSHEDKLKTNILYNAMQEMEGVYENDN